MQWFWILPVALLVAYVAMTGNVRRMGYGVLIASGLLALFLMTGEGLLAPNLSDTAFAGATDDIWNVLTAYLARAAWITFGVGAALIVVGFFVGGREQPTDAGAAPLS